jgi:RHS repeat-associated protein
VAAVSAPLIVWLPKKFFRPTTACLSALSASLLVSGTVTSVKSGSSYSSYTYDNNSNRTSGTLAGNAFTATFDAEDRMLTFNTKTFTYTVNGDLSTIVDSSLPSGHQTTTFTFDELGNLKEVVTPSTTVHYELDGFNRRVQKINGSTVQATYLYRNQTQIEAVLTAAGALSERFVYGTKTNVPDYVVKSGTTYRIISDERGSVRFVVNVSTGAIAQHIEYDEFGNVLSDTSAGFQPFYFAGCLYDQDTKLCHFGAREYDASVGRFLSKDPLLFGGGDTNLYGYVVNDPINRIDPAGTWSFPWPGEIIDPPICNEIRKQCGQPNYVCRGAIEDTIVSIEAAAGNCPGGGGGTGGGGGGGGTGGTGGVGGIGGGGGTGGTGGTGGGSGGSNGCS